MADFDWTEAMAKIDGGKSVTVKLPPPKPVSKTPPQTKSGTTWQWPDDMSQFLPNKDQSKHTDKINTKRSVKEFGAGLLDTAGMLADNIPAIVTGNPALGRLLQHFIQTQPSEMLGTQYENVTGPTGPSEGTADDYAASISRNVGRFAVPVGGAETGVGRMVAEILGGGAGAGVVGEYAAEHAPEGVDSDTARLVGEVFGGGLGAVGAGKAVRSEENRLNILRGASHPNYGSLIDTITSLEGGGTLASPKTSPKGAMGVMQVMPDTARKPGFGIRPWDGKTQEDLARVGRQYAAALNGKYGGDEAKVLAAYNAGPGRVDNLVHQFGNDWWKHLPNETKKYLQNGLNKLDGVNRGRGVRPMSPDEIASSVGDTGATLPEESVAPADGQISGYDTMPEEAYLLNKALEPEEFPVVPEDKANLPSAEQKFLGGRSNVTKMPTNEKTYENKGKRDVLADQQLNNANIVYDAVVNKGVELPAAKWDLLHQTAEHTKKALMWNYIDRKLTPKEIETLKETSRILEEVRTYDPRNIKEAAVDGIGVEPPKPIDSYHEKFTPYVDTENLSAANDTNKIVGDLPVNRLAPAIEHTDGRVYVGPENGAHINVLDNHPGLENYVKSEGWITPEGQYLTRAEASDYIKQPKDHGIGVESSEYNKLSNDEALPPRNLKDLLNDEEGTFRPFGRDKGNTKGPEEPTNSGYEDLSPVEKLLKGIKETKPASAERRRAIHEARQRQDAILETMQNQGAGYREQLIAITGQVPDGADFESIAQHFKPEEVSHLEQLINESPRLRRFEKLATLRSLHNLISPEGVKLPTEHELRNLSDVLGPSVWSDVAKRTKLDGPADVLFKTLNIPKTAQASIDVSGASRQAFPFVTRKEFWNSLPAYFKTYYDRVIHGKDVTAYDKYMESIKDMDTYPEMKQAGVSFTGRGFSFSGEDYFQGSYAEALPVYGTRLIKGSDEGYSGYLNLVRAKVFDTLYKQKIASGGVWTRDQLKELGEYVNTGTGRGGIFKFLRSSKKLLDTAFWSTSLQASRMKLISPHYAARLYVKDKFLFKQYARDMAGMIGVSAGMLVAAKLMFPDVTIETDPRSTDFLKIKKGNRRYDVLGSFQPYLRLIAQELTGEKKNVNTGEIKPLGANPLGMLIGQDQTDHYPGFGDETRMTVLGNFFGNKLAPLPSLFLRYMEQNKYQKIDWPAEAAKLGVPMWLPDVYNEMKTNGAASGAEILAPNFIGWGVQDYEPPKPKASKSTADDPFGDTGFDNSGGFDNDPFAGTGF